MIFALLLAIAWDPYPPSCADFIEVSAWVIEPVIMPCSEPDTGDCIVAYMRTWESAPQQIPLTATRADWVAPDLVSRGVAYMSVSACRGNGCCDTSPGQVKQ